MIEILNKVFTRSSTTEATISLIIILKGLLILQCILHFNVTCQWGIIPIKLLNNSFHHAKESYCHHQRMLSSSCQIHWCRGLNLLKSLIPRCCTHHLTTITHPNLSYFPLTIGHLRRKTNYLVHAQESLETKINLDTNCHFKMR